MNKVSFKNIVNAIEDMCIQTRKQYPKHLQINSFSFGNVSTINIQEIKGVHLHLQPTTSPISRNISEYTYNIYVFDLLDENNILDIMSDCVEIIVDILKKLSSNQFKSEYSFNLINSTDVTPFEGNFEQLTAGWVSTLTFSVYNGSTCSTSFQRYYDVTNVTGSTNVTLDSSYGNITNLIKVNDVVYLSINGENEEDFIVDSITSPNILTLNNSLSIIYNKLRIKNK